VGEAVVDRAVVLEVGEGDVDDGALVWLDPLVLSEPFAPTSDVIGVADPVHPASSAAAAITTTVDAIRRTALTPVHPTMVQVRSPGCAFWSAIRRPNRRESPDADPR
jgi:hypothetical protein